MATPGSSTQTAGAKNPLDSTQLMDPSQVPAGLAIQKTIQETFHKYCRSVVLVIMRTATGSYVSTGTGFVIGTKETNYLVMTCYHCVNSDEHCDTEVSVRLAGKTTEYKAEKLFDNGKADLAIIKVKDVPEAEACLILQFDNLEGTAVLAANTAIIQLGHIFESGAHLNLYPAVAPGTIVTPWHQNASESMNEISYIAPGIHGSSGSAVLLNSKVIGVLYGCTPNGETLFALSSDSVGKVMRSWLETPRKHAPTIEQTIKAMLAKI